tara:strand:+ start:531 stop:878 length:348 start_codon:yes stop_codon:yes gene_type:complete
MTEAKELTFYVPTDRNYICGDELPVKLVEWKALLDEILSEVPEEFRESAFLEVDYTKDYEWELEVKAGWKRMETPTETRLRLEKAAAHNAKNAKAVEAQERQILADLKAKYGELA